MVDFPKTSESKLDISNAKTKFTQDNMGDSGKGVIINAAKSGNGGDTSGWKTIESAKEDVYGTINTGTRNSYGNEDTADVKSGNGGDTSSWGAFKGSKANPFGFKNVPNESDYAKKGTGA
jgi:hypothetical protein